MTTSGRPSCHAVALAASEEERSVPGAPQLLYVSTGNRARTHRSKKRTRSLDPSDGSLTRDTELNPRTRTDRSPHPNLVPINRQVLFNPQGALRTSRSWRAIDGPPPTTNEPAVSCHCGCEATGAVWLARGIAAGPQDSGKCLLVSRHFPLPNLHETLHKLLNYLQSQARARSPLASVCPLLQQVTRRPVPRALQVVQVVEP